MITITLTTNRWTGLYAWGTCCKQVRPGYGKKFRWHYNQEPEEWDTIIHSSYPTIAAARDALEELIDYEDENCINLCWNDDHFYLNQLRKEFEELPKPKFIGTRIQDGFTVSFMDNAQAKKCGFNPTNILQVVRGERETHKGYVWETGPGYDKYHKARHRSHA